MDWQWLDRDLLTLEGRPLNVDWADGETLWVSAYEGADAADQLHYRSALTIELRPGPAASGPGRVGPWCGPAVACSPRLAVVPLVRRCLRTVTCRDLLNYTVAAEETDQPGSVPAPAR